MEKPWISWLKQLLSVLNPPSERTTHPLEVIFAARDVRIEDEDDFVSWAQENGPVVERGHSPTFPGYFSLYILSYAPPSRQLELFLMDLVRTRFLSEKLQLRFFEMAPLTVKDQNFLMGEVHFYVGSRADFEKAAYGSLLLAKEISLYLSSPRYAEPLPRWGACLPKQEVGFQEGLIKLLQRWPEELESDLIQHTHHFLGIAEKAFRMHRSVRHQLRLLCTLYLMRKKLVRALPLSPHELHLQVKTFSGRLHFPFSRKPVTGIVVALSLPDPYSRFEERHIAMAVQKLVPLAQILPESFLIFQRANSSLRLLYLEACKSDGSPFSLQEKFILKMNLEEELKKCVETLSPSIFGCYDIEEVMRNILILSQELHVETDLPQVMISLEGASAKNLIFRIIVVRLLHKGAEPLLGQFQAVKGDFEYMPERSSVIGYLGHLAKEANVFRLQIPREPFLLRSDSSLNLYRARRHVYRIMVKALGEIRDYNGGIFFKRQEMFDHLGQLFQKEDPELLEDFFHSVHPAEMQAILPLSALASLFELFLRARKADLSREPYFLYTEKKEPFFFAALRLQDKDFQEQLDAALAEAGLAWEAAAVVKRHDGLMVGYICRTCPKQSALLSGVLRKCLDGWSLAKRSAQVLRLELHDLPVSLDPRLGGDDMSGILLKMLFEGLMRVSKEGKPDFAVASDVTVSKDGRRYVFALKTCSWNNGEPVTAHDFCYAWKKILSPDFETAFAYLFYVIKNAEKAKQGLVALEAVGVHALDNQTLVVELEHPCSYFLELTANPLYSPVHHRINQIQTNWPLQTGQAYMCNGPFCLEQADARENYQLKKNRHYWDASAVQLENIHISRATARKAWEMFKQGEIDWLGRPTRPWEPFFSLRPQRPIEKLAPSRICWCSCNMQQFPFQSLKMRLALSYSLDRQAIAHQMPNDCIPAFSPLPLIHAQHQDSFARDKHEQALLLFEEALKELGVSRGQWPVLTLIHANNPIRQEMALAVVRQWQEVLGITVRAQAYDFRDLFAKMTKGQYQLGMIMWRPLADDPLYTLNVFKSSAEDINWSKWESSSYQRLLDRANRETNIGKRKKIAKAAETILIKEMPVIPVVHEPELFSRREHVEGVCFSRIGNIDFKNVSIKPKEIRL